MNTTQTDKPYEILQIRYSFDKATRRLRNEPQWIHYRSYRTIEGTEDALCAKRRDILDKAYRDYPGDEIKYPHIKPTINIYRYKSQRKP